MNWRLFIALIRKETLHILRDKGLVLFLIYAFTFDVVLAAKGFRIIPEEVSIAVYDEDHSSASGALIDRIRPPSFKRPFIVHNLDEVDKLLLESSVVVVLVIPAGFQRDLQSGKSSSLQVLIDGTQSTAAYLSSYYLSRIVESFLRAYIKAPLQEGPLLIKEKVFFNTNLRDDLYEGLNEFFMVITLIGMILPAMLIIREKEYGTIEQVMVSPLSFRQLLFTKIITSWAVMLSAAAFCYVFVLNLYLGFPLKGGLLRVLFITLLYQFCTTGISLFMASVAKRFSQIGMLTIVIFTPMLLISGGWVPPEALPYWLRQTTKVSPLKAFLDSGISLMIRGSTITEQAENIIKLFLIGIVLFVSGYRVFLKRQKQL
ncbi:MAG: ABC transporter permease [Nitrospirae bacterium]|nr:MAG: ABC transporter permease [Nitrospirota bacterium]